METYRHPPRVFLLLFCGYKWALSPLACSATCFMGYSPAHQDKRTHAVYSAAHSSCSTVWTYRVIHSFLSRRISRLPGSFAWGRCPEEELLGRRSILYLNRCSPNCFIFLDSLVPQIRDLRSVLVLDSRYQHFLCG